MFNLKSEVVVIAGGGGLIGSGFADVVVELGATVVIGEASDFIDNKPEGLDDDKAHENNYPSIELDITSRVSIDAAIAKINKKYGPITCFVNCAYPRNANYGRSFFEVSYDDFCENTSLHLGGYFLAMQRFGEYFSKNGKGNIINLASVYGVIPPRFEIYEGTPLTMPIEYAAIKSGIIHMTKYLSKYLKGSGVRVNCLSPGGVLDNQNELFIGGYNDYCSTKGLLDKEDLNGALAFLISEASRYVNGQNIIVDDGFVL